VGSPLRLSCGSLRRSRRRSGGNLTLGLPGSSTEQPIPWFYRDPHHSLVCPVRSAAGAAASSGRYVSNDGSSCGIPQGSTAEAPQAVVPTTVAHLPGSTTPGPLAPPRHQHFRQKRRPVPLGSGRPPQAAELSSCWLSVTSCLPCWRRADAAGEV
jgi:hypothetical protein